MCPRAPLSNWPAGRWIEDKRVCLRISYHSLALARAPRSRPLEGHESASRDLDEVNAFSCSAKDALSQCWMSATFEGRWRRAGPDMQRAMPNYLMGMHYCSHTLI